MVIGWDIGGANVKAARLADASGAAAVVERPFALWRDPYRLAAILAEVADKLGRADAAAVTMTAELADCFATKRDGVVHVIDAFMGVFPLLPTWIFGVDGRFRTAAKARLEPGRVAAANWMASALMVARSRPDAIFVDVGTTTADIIPIAGGRVCARGRTDTGRLRSGELVYTGVLRTPVCAVTRTVPLRGRRCRVAAEHFAIAADAHRWLGRIDDDQYTCETPDGRGRGRDAAGARLARMICADAGALRDEDITAIAEHVARAQVQQIANGIHQVVRRLADAPPAVAIVAGSGSFLAADAARSCGLAVSSLAETLGPDTARALPATAVASLLIEMLSVSPHTHA